VCGIHVYMSHVMRVHVGLYANCTQVAWLRREFFLAFSGTCTCLQLNSWSELALTLKGFCIRFTVMHILYLNITVVVQLSW